MKVAVTGATGFVGTYLVKKLRVEGYEVLILSRGLERAKQLFPDLEVIGYNPKDSGSWQSAIAGCDGVVNLAGAPIAERWNEEYKKEILESREMGTRKIVEAIGNANPRPQVLVNPSAIGYYGTSETGVFDENSPPGKDFLAQVCQRWEAEAKKVKDYGVRLVILRFGIVLGDGGALAKMLTPFKLFAGGPIGSGNQWFSWIHHEDLVNLIIYALKNSAMEGTFNATAPNPVRMNELCHTLGEVMHRPSWLPVPSFALELLLGDGAKVVLEGQQVLPRLTESSGFQYQYPALKPALAEIIGV
jgi:hypothetical protein